MLKGNDDIYLIDVQHIPYRTIHKFLQKIKEATNLPGILTDFNKLLDKLNRDFAGAYFCENRDLYKLDDKDIYRALNIDFKENPAYIFLPKPEIVALNPLRLTSVNLKDKQQIVEGVRIRYQNNGKTAIIYRLNGKHYLEQKVNSNEPETEKRDKLNMQSKISNFFF